MRCSVGRELAAVGASAVAVPEAGRAAERAIDVAGPLNWVAASRATHTRPRVHGVSARAACTRAGRAEASRGCGNRCAVSNVAAARHPNAATPAELLARRHKIHLA